MKPEVVLRALDKDDLPQVALVHIDAFPNSALSRLGREVVEQYYVWQLTGPHEKVRATGAFVVDDCAGFSFSGIFNASTSGFIQNNRALLISSVLRHPGLFLDRPFLERMKAGLRLLVGFAKRKPRTERNEVLVMPNYGILSIAVSPRFQKLGIGQMLMLDAEDEAVRYGRRKICLTVHPANKKAVRFYEKQDWQRFVTNDLWNGAMTKNLK
jgi:ribosomal protein S18 acetylase RimI-like enzyme